MRSPLDGEYYYNASCSGSNDTVSIDSAPVRCTFPYAGQYISSACQEGSFLSAGSDTIIKECTLPSANQYVSSACQEGSSLSVGSNTIIRYCTNKAHPGEYLSACVPGNATHTGTDASVLVCPANFYCVRGAINHCPPGTTSSEGTAQCFPVSNASTSTFIVGMSSLFGGWCILWLVLDQFYLKSKYPGSNNTVILTFVLGLYDLCSDIIYAYNLTNSKDLLDTSPLLVEEATRLSTYYWLSMAVPFVLNLIFVYYLVTKEVKSNENFKLYLKENSSIFMPLVVIGATYNGVESLKILSSGLLGSKVFKAPFSRTITSTFLWGGILSSVFEDVPQFIIQLYFLLGFPSIISASTLLQFTASCLMLISKIMSRCTFMNFNEVVKGRGFSASSYVEHNE